LDGTTAVRINQNLVKSAEKNQHSFAGTFLFLIVVLALAQHRVPVLVSAHVVTHVLAPGKKKFSKAFNWLDSLNYYLDTVLAVDLALDHHRVPVLVATHVVNHVLAPR
jgi:hypothetical protein